MAAPEPPLFILLNGQTGLRCHHNTGSMPKECVGEVYVVFMSVQYLAAEFFWHHTRPVKVYFAIFKKCSFFLHLFDFLLDFLMQFTHPILPTNHIECQA